MTVNEMEKPKSEAEGGAPRNGGNGDNAAPEKRSPAKIVLRIILVAALVAGIALGVRYWLWTRGHASTDDAYVTSDVVQISPQVSGTVERVLVEDNELVKKGQLLVTLDDSTYQATVARAKADLGVAVAAAQSAGVNVNLVEQTGSAGITQAQGTLSGAESSVESAKVAVDRSKASLNVAMANERNSAAKVNSAAAAVTRAKSDVESAKAALSAAQAKYENSTREARRFNTLAKEGAASQETADTANTDVVAKKADLDTARQNVEAKQSSVESAEADLNAARQQASASAAMVQQSTADLAAARQNVLTADAGKRQAQGAAKSGSDGADQGGGERIGQDKGSGEASGRLRQR